MKVVNGRCHQGQIVSNYAGFQCTAIALYALITVCSVNPAFFTPDTIDYIVQNGHQMYHQLISQSNNPTPRFLGHWELPHYVQQNNESIEIHRYENILNGVVGMDSNFPFTTVSIEEALPMAFSISNYFICTFGDSTIAIFRLERSEQWFIFDSHSRNSTGLTNPFGSATIIELSNYEQCVQFLRQNYEGKPFEITPVVFEQQDVQSIDYSAPENNLIESMDVPIETNEENNNVKYITEPQGTHENHQDVQINNKKNIYINIDALNGDYKKYEQQIRLTGNNYCCCWEKILFEDQIKKMPHSFQFRLSNGKVISDCSAICGKCSSQLTQSKQPNKYVDNNLSAGLVPECLQSLDIIQRRLISQIQSFMTIIILPGGQYAEKGLAIHFPLDMESYFKSLQTFQNENVLLVV